VQGKCQLKKNWGSIGGGWGGVLRSLLVGLGGKVVKVKGFIKNLGGIGYEYYYNMSIRIGFREI